MPRSSRKKTEVEGDSSQSGVVVQRVSLQTPESERLAVLVDRVRRSRKHAEQKLAFEQIENSLKPRIKNLCSRFTISGMQPEDIYQEALIALYDKAIKDFDKTRGMFDRFALLCIRRALSTKRKTSFQNRNRLWNGYVSLDQERSDGGEGEGLTLVNIKHATKGDVLTLAESREFFSSFRERLDQKLSAFEAEVWMLFLKKHTYEEIADVIRERTPKGSGRFKGVDNITVKGVDNALTRTKQKAKRILKSMVEKDGLPESVAIRLRSELFGDIEDGKD